MRSRGANATRGHGPAALPGAEAPPRDAGRGGGQRCWYRAMPWNGFFRLMRTTITVPTMHVFSDGDTFLSVEGAQASGGGVGGDYRFEMLHGVSHWMVDEDPDAVADVLLEWFAAHPTEPVTR